MLYMVEMNLMDPSREAEWDEWYLSHLHKLLRVLGFYSAQRFKSITPADSPLLAIYDVENAGVLTSKAYTSVGGRGSADQWKHILTNWHRNLFAYEGRAPSATLAEYLFVADRHGSARDPLPVGFISLKPAGLDRTLVERAVKVVSEPPPSATAFGSWSLRVLKPMTPCLTL